MTQKISFIRTKLNLTLCLFLASLLACGDDDSSDQSETAFITQNKPQVPTMPAVQFKQPTSIIKKSDEVTETAATEEDVEAAIDAPNLALGEQIYHNKCASCHGEDAAGVADKGSALAGLAFDEEAFTDLLRTGGDIGPTHLFGPNAVSPDGVRGVYGYLQIFLK